MSDIPDFETIKECAENGDPVAQSDLGVSYYTGLNTKVDYVAAEYWLIRSYESGNILALHNLSQLYCVWSQRLAEKSKEYELLARNKGINLENK